MASAYVEEGNITSKLDFSVWVKAFKYIKKLWPIVIVLLICMLYQAFYDSSYTPSSSAALISAFNENGGTLVGGNVPIWDVILRPKILGFEFALTFKYYLILSFSLMLIRSIAMFGLFFSMNYIEMKIMTELRKDAFKRIQELSFSYFDKTPSGWLIARLNNDAASISEVLSNSVLRVFQIAMSLIFTLITMFTQSWLLSLIVLATTPLIFVVVMIFEKLILKYSRIARNAYSYFVGWLAESINGNKTIKTMSIEETVKDECADITNDIRKKRLKTQRISGMFWPAVDFLANLTTALIILIFPFLGIESDTLTSAALLVLFIQFVSHIYNPIRQFAEIFSDLMATQASVEKLFLLINTVPTLVDKPEVIAKYGDLFHNKTENFEPLNGDIKFNHVSFSYNEGTEVIHDLNLHISQGTSLAIVGETGSGKSTTVNLLCRFYEPTKGEILIDDVNYRDRSVGWLRSNIGYVQQAPFIFKGTVKDNIRYGRLDATDEEIVDVCKKLDIHNFIITLKNGYDTYLRDGGNELSQGQKQLISFARAIIRNPKILILDEATSSIDTETEHDIQGAINKMLVGRTSLIIAHRLSTIVGADRILVMKDGVVVEDGNHKTLMEKKGYYHKLYTNQFKELNIGEQLSQYKEQIEDKNINI